MSINSTKHINFQNQLQLSQFITMIKNEVTNKLKLIDNE